MEQVSVVLWCIVARRGEAEAEAEAGAEAEAEAEAEASFVSITQRQTIVAQGGGLGTIPSSPNLEDQDHQEHGGARGGGAENGAGVGGKAAKLRGVLRKYEDPHTMSPPMASSPVPSPPPAVNAHRELSKGAHDGDGGDGTGGGRVSPSLVAATKGPWGKCEQLYHYQYQPRTQCT